MGRLVKLVADAAEAMDIPVQLAVAMAHTITGCNGQAYRYEPTYDARYIAASPAWRGHPEFLRAGPTAEDWFGLNRDRLHERREGWDYSFVAQEHLAARYGPFLVYYPEVVRQGFTDAPEALLEPTVEALTWSLSVLRAEIEWASERGWSDPDATKIGVARFNGNHLCNRHPDHLDNQRFVTAVNRAHRTLFQTPFWGPA